MVRSGINRRNSLKEVGRKREVPGEEIESRNEGFGGVKVVEGSEVGVEMSHVHGGRG